MSATRLALVVPDLRVGGLQAMVVRLLLALDAREFRPHVYTFDDEGPLADRLDAAGIAHSFLPRGRGVRPLHARALAQRFRDDGIELVHCHNITALFHGLRAALRAGPLPVLYTEHDRSLPAPWRQRVVHRWLARRVDRTVAVSRRLREALVAHEDFPPQRTRTLVNGVPDPCAAFAGDRAAARQELGWDARPVALAVGSLTEVKNHAGLLRAWRGVVAALPAARLVVAGDGPLRAELAAAGAAELLGERSDVPRLLAAADVFVLPSHSEGLPLSLAEAHGAGRPSVAFDVGGNGEVLQDGRTGRLVPYPDEQALAGALVELLADADLARRQGAAARQRYREAFTHERMVEAYVALYRELSGARVSG